jgi:hypothetical protein
METTPVPNRALCLSGNVLIDVKRLPEGDLRYIETCRSFDGFYVEICIILRYGSVVDITLWVVFKCTDMNNIKTRSCYVLLNNYLKHIVVCFIFDRKHYCRVFVEKNVKLRTLKWINTKYMRNGMADPNQSHIKWTNLMFCWPCIVIRALLAYLQEALRKQQLVYCVSIMSAVWSKHVEVVNS